MHNSIKKLFVESISKRSLFTEAEMGKILPFKRPEPKASSVQNVPLDQMFKMPTAKKLLGTDYDKQVYGWGELRTVSLGGIGKVVIHPEHWFRISNLKQDGVFKFKDETRSEWTIARDDNKFSIMKTGSEKKFDGDWNELVQSLE